MSMVLSADERARIAAQYGAVVPPGLAVQCVPQGQRGSGETTYLWDGRALVPVAGPDEYRWGGARGKIMQPRPLVKGPGRHPHSPARRAEVTLLLDQGLTPPQIARHLGISPQSARCHITALGRTARSGRADGMERRAARLAEIPHLAARGMTLPEVAAHYGLSKGQLVRDCRDIGFRFPAVQAAGQADAGQPAREGAEWILDKAA